VIRRKAEFDFTTRLRAYVLRYPKPAPASAQGFRYTAGGMARKLRDAKVEARESFYRRANEALDLLAARERKAERKRKQGQQQRVVPAEPFRAPVLEKRGKRWVAMR
jgi:hypothetical protein